MKITSTLSIAVSIKCISTDDTFVFLISTFLYLSIISPLGKLLITQVRCKLVSQPAEECTKINYTVVAVLLLPSVSSNTIFLSRIQRLICQETYRIYLHKRMRRAHKEQECCEKNLGKIWSPNQFFQKNHFAFNCIHFSRAPTKSMHFYASPQ